MSGASDYTEQAVNNAIRNNASFIVTQTYFFLHTGDPSDVGNSNFATNNTGKSITWNVPDSTLGTMTNSNALQWTSVAATETYTHGSIRSGTTSGAGTCIVKGPLSANVSVNTGDNFEIPAGSLTITVA